MGTSTYLIPDEDSYLSEYRQFRERLIKLRRAWEEFSESGQVTEPEEVNPEVLISWKRCRTRMIDPYDSANVTSLSPDELRKRLEKCRQIIGIASPLLQTLAQSVRGSGFRIDLFDSELFLLEQYGEEEALREAGEYGSIPGVNRSEINSGTNAINLAARLQRPVQLVGPEHYKAALHHWTCSAVPIFSPERDFLGVINVAGHFSLLHKHTLGMAIAIGKVIEQGLQQLELMSALEGSNQHLNDVIQAVSDGLVVLDVNGVITTVNQSALSLFGTGPSSMVGCRARDVFGSENPFSEVLRSGRPIVDREILLKARGRKQFFVGTIEPISGKRGREGVMGVLKPLASAKGFVQNVAGLKAHFTFAQLVGSSPSFRHVVEVAKQAAELPTTILIQGESGTGKELFAQAIHNASPYKEGPFVALNCAAIPGELVESEFFGYESGAFTGARKEGRPGKFELAEGGSLFLDEIASMPLNIQAKILRVLQNRTIMRVGGVTEIPLSTRLICATNRDLHQQVQEGSFREDLFYRINVLTIVVPPLRERPGDLPNLVDHFCARLSQRMGVHFGVDAAVYDLLAGYHWPGNVRELENLIERSLILALARGSKNIQVEDILSYVGVRKARTPGSEEVDSAGYSLRRVESDVIREVLYACKGNVSHAARLLGIHRTTLHRKLKSMGEKYSNSHQL